MERRKVSTISKALPDFYKRLDIARNTDHDGIETAYARMALKYHPDVAGDSPSAQERFAKINEAYSVLGYPDKKKEYDLRLGTPGVQYQEDIISSSEGAKATGGKSGQTQVGPGDDAANSKSGLMSKRKLDRIKTESKQLIKKGDFWRSNTILRQAASFYPRDIELRKLLAKSAAGRGRLREAVEELKTASEVEYYNPEIHYLMGEMYLQGNQLDNAAKSFSNAISWQEDYRPALEGIKKIKALKNKDIPWWKKLMRMGK